MNNALKQKSQEIVKKELEKHVRRGKHNDEYFTCFRLSNTSLLHQICLCGWTELAVYLIEKFKFRVNSIDSIRHTPFHKACLSGNIELVQLLLKDYNCIDICKYANNLLLLSLESNNNEIVDLLLSDSVCYDPNKESSDLFAKLVEKSDLRMFKRLVEKHHYVPVKSAFQSGSLKKLCASGNINFLTYLCQCDFFSQFEKAHASKMLNPNCDPTIAEFLISKRRFDPNLIVENSTILVHACEENDLEKVKYLVEKCNCDPSFQYKPYYSGWESPLIVACQKGYNDIFVYLIEECGLMSLCNGAKGKFLLDSTDMEHLEILKVLIPSSKIDPTEIVLKACKNGNLKIIETVIEASDYKYPSLQSVVSESPLFVACDTGNMDVVEFFYKRNCRINFIEQEEEGLKLLIRSVNSKNLPVVKFLVDKCGCDFPLFRDSDLLFYTACATGSLEIVKYFFEVFKVSYENWSCSREIVLGACKSGKVKVVKYLCDKWKLNGYISLEIVNEMYSGTNSFDLLKYFLGCIGNKESDIIIKSLFKLLQNVSKMGDLKSFELLTSKYEHVLPSKFDSDTICTFVSNACSAKRFDAAQYMLKFLSIEDEQLIIFVFYKFGYDINELAKLFNSKTIVAATDEDNNTLLHLACEKDDLAAVEFLLNNSPCPKSCLECQNEEFKAPLHLTPTCYSWNTKVCEYILRNFHSHVDFGMFHIILRYIHCAYDNKKIEFVKFMFQKKVVPFTLSDQTGDTIFHKACSRGDEEIIEYITRQPECDFLIRNNVGNTPIHCACTNTTITTYLLDFILTKGRACFDIANGKGYKPLHLAIENSNFLLGFLIFKQTDKHFDWLTLQLMIETGMLFHLEEEKLPSILVMNNDFSDNGLSLGQLVYSSGNLKFMKHCISAGLNPFQLTAFHEIIHESNFKFLEHLISNYRREFVDIVLNNDVKHAILNCSSIMFAFSTLCQLDMINTVDNAGDTLLHKACIVGHSILTQKLIDEFHLSPEKENNSGMTPLRNACAHGFLKITKYIMIRMKSCDFHKNPENACLFFDACDSGSIDLVEYLFSKDFDFQFEIKDKNGNSLLHHACEKENYQIIDYLVKEQKANPKKLNNEGISPLELACRLCNASIVSFFIFKADCRNECETSKTLQHFLFSDSSININKLFTLFNVLRNAGCDLSIPDDKGRNLLIKCINRLLYYDLDLSCTWFLINDCGCDPFKIDSTGKSFISLAIEKQKQEVILNCIQRQYRFEPAVLQESDNAHLLIFAYNSHSFHFNDIVQLITRGFNPKLPNENGSTLLHESCRKQDLQMVEFLLDKCDCAELCQIENNTKESPISIAINGMNPPIFEKLLHAAQINDPLSLLELNTTYLSVPILKLFVTKYECDPKRVKDYNDKTLLHKACRKGDLELVKVLIEECKVDPHQTDWKDQFALTDLLESVTVFNATEQNEILDYLIQKLDHKRLKQHDQDRLLVDKAMAKRNNQALQTLIMKGGCRPGTQYSVPHGACGSGRLSLLKFVLKEYNEQYCLIQCISTDKLSVIHCAIYTIADHMPIMEYLLEHYPAGFTLYNQTESLLNYACKLHKNLDFLKWLIEKAKCNPKSGERVTLLHLACSAGDYKTVKYLMEEHSCNPREKDEEGLNSFNRACASGNVELVTYLLRNHNMKKTKYTRESVLHSALKNSHFRIFNLLRREGFSLSSIDQDGNSLSHLICGIGNIPLLNKCPNLDKEWKMLNFKKQTPLHIACKMRKLDVVKFLVNTYNLKFDAEIFSDILHTWYNDSTCLNIQEKISFLQFMVTSFGCDIDAKNLNGDSLLHIVASANDLELCKVMCEEYACKVACTNSKGLTPLHCACSSGAVGIVKYLTTDYYQCLKNVIGQPNFLHNLEFQKIDRELLDYLILDLKCDHSHIDCNGNTILHKACMAGNIGVVQYLVEYERADCLSILNLSKDSPIQVSCKSGYLEMFNFLFDSVSTMKNQPQLQYVLRDILRYLIKIAETESLDELNMPMIQAVIAKCVDQYREINLILKMVVEEQNVEWLKYLILSCKVNATLFIYPNNKRKTNLIHFCCEKEYYESLRCLIVDCKCNPFDYEWSKSKMNPLKFACTKGDEGMVRCLYSGECKSRTFLKDHGESALKYAFDNNHDDILIYLLETHKLDPEKKIVSFLKCITARKLKLLASLCAKTKGPAYIDKSQEQTLLHYACSTADLELVKCLIVECKCPTDCKCTKKCKCTTDIKNKNGQTPLFCAKHFEIVEYLIMECKVNLKINDQNNNTPLHLLCFLEKFSTSAFEYVLSTGEVDLMEVNKSNQTALGLLQEINKDKHSKIIHVIKNYETRYLLNTYVNVFILGHPGAGKTSLTQAIINKYHQKWLRFNKKVIQIQRATAGMIPTILHDKHLILHDFAGHIQYHSSHLTVIDRLIKQFSGVFVLVLNLTDKDKISQLHYWITLIDAKREKLSVQTTLIVIASHCDKRSKDQQVEDIKSIRSELTLRTYTYGNDYEIFPHNCCTSLQGNNDVIQVLARSCDELRKEQKFNLSLYCYSLYAFLEEIKENDRKIENRKSVYMIKDLRKREEHAKYQAYLPRKNKDLALLLDTLDSIGLILFFRKSNESLIEFSWVVIDKGDLLTGVIGKLLLSEDMAGKGTYFERYPNLASKTGIVASSSLYELCSELNLPMQLVIEFLLHMELCLEIPKDLFQHSSLKPKDLLKRKNDSFLFFPALNYFRNPLAGRKKDFKLGWCLRCAEKEFFLSNEIHHLILRMAYKHAVQDPNFSQSLFPEIHRDCIISKDGIQWHTEVNNIEIIIEFIENGRSLVLLMKGVDEDIKSKSSEIIAELLLLCENESKRSEYIIDLEKLVYPVEDIKENEIYSIKDLASQFYKNYCKKKKKKEI